MRKFILFLLLINGYQFSSAQVLSEREQSRVVDEILHERFTVLFAIDGAHRNRHVGGDLQRIQRRSGIENHVAIDLAFGAQDHHVGF